MSDMRQQLLRCIHDQYTKAFNQIGPVPSTEGRLMSVVEQVIVFEQTSSVR